MESSTTVGNTQAQNTRLVTFFHAVLFVLGFSIVFIVGWGGTATLVGQAFGVYKNLLGRIGGVIILLFGLSTLGLLRMPWSYYSDTRRFWSPGKDGGTLSSLMMGRVGCQGIESPACFDVVFGTLYLLVGQNQQIPIPQQHDIRCLNRRKYLTGNAWNGA